MTLIGGYTNGNWEATPNPVANPTLLDAESNGRVAYITNNAVVTLNLLANSAQFTERGVDHHA